MDYTHIIQQLKNATTFDLYRLHVAISNELQNPDRLMQIKRSLRIGDRVSYFDFSTNRLIEGELLEVRKTNAGIRHLHDGQHVLIDLYMINIDNADVHIHRSSGQSGMDKNQIAVGDRVGFLGKDHIERYGIVLRLNHKTVTLQTDEGMRWRVAYSFLFPVVDGEKRDLDGVKVIRHNV